MNLDIGAVLFDCDGVLVNSEELVVEISLGLLSDIGLEYTKQEFSDNFLGFTSVDYKRTINLHHQQKFGKDLDEEIFKDMQAKSSAHVKANVKAIDGVVDVVKNMQYRKAVASSSLNERLIDKLQKAQIFEDFNPHIYAGDMVKNGKPEPDIFLLAANSINIEPRKCVVIEDSKNGVIAANKAGMQAIGFIGGNHCSARHKQDLLDTGAVAVANDMSEIEDLLAKIKLI